MPNFSHHSSCRYPTDADLLSKVGYVQLQLGDLGGAQQTFSKVDALVTDTTDEKLLNLAGRNRGLLHFAEKQYTKAFNEFTAVLSRSPHDMVSANNKVRRSDIVLSFIKILALLT
jgi:Flp pilus assembly protein TadD